jgi:sigma-B regulation protein RsbU (phosphoserine phosphatase)
VRKRADFLTGNADRDRRNVDLLLGAVEELYGRAELDALMRSAVDGAIQVTGAQRGLLLLPGPDGALGVRMARKSDGLDLPPKDLRYSRSVADKVWSTGEAHVALDHQTRSGAAANLGQSILDLRLLSVLAVPLRAKDRPLGVLYVDSTAAVKAFNDSDRMVFESLAGLAGVAIERARMAAEEAEARRLAQEIDVARKIQLSLLPKDPEAPKGYDLATAGRSCAETSGDYHDVIPLDGGALALVVGDVSGHGLGAALFMASVRALLRTLLHTRNDPVAAFSGLNAFLCRDMPDESFMSLFLGVLDPGAKRLRYVSAGHNPPLLWRKDADLAELARTGPVLGVVPDFEYRMAEAPALVPGDALLLFTDGLYESQDPAKEIYGEDRLHASLARHAAASPLAKPVLDGVLGDLDAFTAGRPADDDVTCIVLRVKDGGA